MHLDPVLMEFIKKLTVAMVLGGVIGFERKMSNKAAGLRTMMLICMGACLFVTLAVYMSQNPAVFGQADVFRVVGHAIAGIGFLGAGTIMQNRGEKSYVEGLTTAAAIWFVAGMGMLIGAGFYSEALIATIFSGMVLFIFNKIEVKIVWGVRALKELLFGKKKDK